MKMLSVVQWVRSVSALGSALAALSPVNAQNYVHDSEPELMSYDELVQLSLGQKLNPELAEKLRVVTSTPFVNNEAY